MLRILSDGVARNCERVSRRELLSIGTLGIGGLSLANLLQSQSQAASGGPIVRDKAVVVLNLQGGPTHIETFDPKMTAPSEYRAMFGEVQTKLPGVTFGSHFQRLATWADRLSVVRSYRHGIGSHATAAMHVMAGGNSTGANMGSLYSRVAGMTNPQTGIPNCAVIAPPSAGKQFKNLGAQTQRVTSVGTLPKAYAPFDPSAGSDIVRNMELKISESRLDDRKSLLGNLDQLQRQINGSGMLDSATSFQQQAFDVILGGIGDAFDLQKEDPNTIARYDTSRLAIPKSLYKKKNKNLLRQSRECPLNS